MVNSPAMLLAMARRMRDLGVRPEIEAFDTGHILLAKWLQSQGVLDDPIMIQLCMGIPWGAPDDLATFLAMRQAVPADWTTSAGGGSHARVGLEDNIWLGKGQLATNGALVRQARQTIEGTGARLLGPQE